MVHGHFPNSLKIISECSCAQLCIEQRVAKKKSIRGGITCLLWIFEARRTPRPLRSRSSPVGVYTPRRPSRMSCFLSRGGNEFGHLGGGMGFW